jgi:integrase
LGFLDYVERVAKAPGDNVFPQLKPGGPDSKLGYYFSKWFSRYRQSVGVYEDGLDYHSFRHGVTTKLFGAGVDSVTVNVLTGHEGQGISEKVYLKGLPLSRLYDAICKVEWPELDEIKMG